MYLRLDELLIHLQSNDAAINVQWAALFQGYLSPISQVATALTAVHLRLRLQLVDHLPPLPAGSFLYRETSHSPPQGVGSLSVYQVDSGQTLLCFQDAAIVSLTAWPRLDPADGVPTLDGVVNGLLLRHGRLEDLTFASLASYLRQRSYYLLHAFAVVDNGRAILLVGPSGSGKSTTGLSLVLAGRQYLANDTVLLQQRSDGVYALPTPGGISLKSDTFQLLPRLRHLIDRPAPTDGHRRLFLPAGIFVTGHPTAAPVAAVYFPQVENYSHSSLSRQRRATCLARLMEASVDRWDEAALPGHLDLLQQLSQQAEACVLHLGRDFDQLPSLLTP